MLRSLEYMPAAFSLSVVGVWGTSNFIGGLGARRVNVFLFTSVASLCALICMTTIAAVAGAAFPDKPSTLWALAAGSIGGVSLATFYRALASGKMGLTAPVAAVLGAGIPTVVTGLTVGLPGYRQLAGFFFAIMGVWLISRSEGGPGRPEGLGLAILAGIGFAGYYLCVNQARTGSALWVAVMSRIASVVVTTAFVPFSKGPAAIPARVVRLAIIAGCLDIIGCALFVRATQIGRLDEAVVLSSLYPAITVLQARAFLHEHFSRGKTIGMLAALVAVPMIAG